MKNHLSLVILASVILIFNFFQLQAQIPASNNNEKDKQNEIEVKRFADSFVESFIEVKDIDKIPATFFERDFKTRFANEDCISNNFKYEKISISDKYKIGMAAQNFFNLLLVTTAVTLSEEQYKESESKIPFQKYLPPNVLEKIQKSKWLKAILEDSDDEIDDSNPNTSIELSEVVAEMSGVSNELRLYLGNHPIKNSPNLLALKEKNFKYYSAEVCKGESCLGLPENTPIFAVHKLGQCLRIAQINGEWKIVQIYSLGCED